MAEISSLALMYVLVTVNYTDPVTGNLINPTADTVVMAFTATTFNVDPQNTDWKAATWRAGGPPYVAQCLVGPSPGVIQLAKGKYRIWVKVTDNPEIPVLPSGFLLVR